VGEQDEARCREAARVARVDAAIRQGSLEALRAAVGDDDFPNAPGPLAIGNLLCYAIYHAPLAFVRELIDAGADVNYDAADGFPALIAALSATASPGYSGRDDRHELLELLLERGADVERRGINDCTPLHWAAGAGDRRSVELLLAHGADIHARTRIDDVATAKEIAQAGGHSEVATLLDRREKSQAATSARPPAT
jgi:ankyrin repeat protein